MGKASRRKAERRARPDLLGLHRAGICIHCTERQVEPGIPKALWCATCSRKALLNPAKSRVCMTFEQLAELERALTLMVEGDDI